MQVFSYRYSIFFSFVANISIKNRHHCAHKLISLLVFTAVHKTSQHAARAISVFLQKSGQSSKSWF